MIHREEPLSFNPRFSIVSCYVEVKNNILLLHRNESKSEGDKWGVPAGKIDEGEDEIKAMIRELQEETGISLQPTEVHYLTKVFVRYPEYDFIYHMFKANLDNYKSIKINPKEHQSFKWVSPSQALGMNLVRGLDQCIEMFYDTKHA